MQVNGINSFSYAPKMAFKGNEEGTTAPAQEGTEKKINITKKQAAIGGGIAAAVVALGTTLYAASRGKVINGKDSKFLKNIGDGFKSIFTKKGREAFKTAKDALKAASGAGQAAAGAGQAAAGAGKEGSKIVVNSAEELQSLGKDIEKLKGTAIANPAKIAEMEAAYAEGVKKIGNAILDEISHQPLV